MPLYVNGSVVGTAVVKVVDVGDKISAAIRENGGRVGDISKYTAQEMKFVHETFSRIACEESHRISLMKWMEGVDITKVVDICEVFKEDFNEMVD